MSDGKHDNSPTWMNSNDVFEYLWGPPVSRGNYIPQTNANLNLQIYARRARESFGKIMSESYDFDFSREKRN